MTPQPEHVAQVYADSYFKDGGAGYPDYLGESDLLIAHGARYGRLLRRYMQPETVLDVGAAAGFILKGLQTAGWTGMGLEPNAAMAAYARDQMDMNVQAGALEDFESQQQFTLVSMIQVIAHFFDVHKALAHAARVTRPGGYWLIESWNKDSWMARMFGVNWHEYSPPSVLRWFAPADLTHLVSRYGFKPVAQGRPGKWLNGAHVKSLVGYKLSGTWMQNPADVMFRLMPDNLPIPYPAFDLFWGLYQKQP
ncbi:MAG: class I SAM-dependent methyltransferase [Anaerolineae bacterium]|nr:class I SAM-dependent methyltransferase [Anaerolineae bacterium]